MKKLFFVLLLAFTAYHCCKDEPTDSCDNACAETFICNNGTCECPANSYVFKKVCSRLLSNEYYGICVSGDCSCLDTIIIGLRPANSNGEGMLYDRKSNTDEGDISGTYFYYPSSLGDSIEFFLSYSICHKPDNAYIIGKVAGRFNFAKDTLRVKAVNYYQHTTDTCALVFHK
ncbi:MAG: hypothetical protein KA974_05385 [Saprospiraceae bacterium]|nr:hypothetical protein [Saprospiraceae bacterium]